MILERYVQCLGKPRGGADHRAVTTSWTEAKRDQGRAMAGEVGGGCGLESSIFRRTQPLPINGSARKGQREEMP